MFTTDVGDRKFQNTTGKARRRAIEVIRADSQKPSDLAFKIITQASALETKVGVSGVRNRISFVTEDDNTDAVSAILWRAQVAHTSALSGANESAFVSSSRDA